MSYPARLLSRAIHPLSNEVLEYANAEDRAIVVYDWDERTAASAANLMFEKGVENVILLSGGVCHENSTS
jgi:centrosomal protein CEP41